MIVGLVDRSGRSRKVGREYTATTIAICALVALTIATPASSANISLYSYSDSAGFVTLFSPVVMDSKFNQLDFALVGQQLILSTGFANTKDIELEYVILTEARNEMGVTVFLESRWGNVISGKDAEIHHIWRPEESGTFELRSFLMSADCFPDILTPVNISKVAVKSSDGSHVPVPRVEDLTMDQIQLLTKEEIEAIELEDQRRSDIDSEVSDVEDQRLEAKERRIRELIWSDERIKGYQETFAVFGFDSDFVMEQSLCDNAEMTIHVAKERHVDGDWQTSYIRTLSGRLELKVSVIGGAISSIAENPLNDTTSEYSFSEEQKKAIRVAVENNTVQELFQNKEMEIGVVRVSGVYSGQCEDRCAIMIIYQKGSSEKHLAVMIDKLQERVVSIRPSKDWISADPDSLRVVEAGEYRVDFSFNDPLTKAEFGEITSHYGIKIEYFEYRATKNITGGVSTEVFANIDALENDLRARHDAEIIGVHNLLARGQSEDLLRFIEAKRDEISEFSVVEVIR